MLFPLLLADYANSWHRPYSLLEEYLVLDSKQTIANAVLEHSEYAQVFRRHRIDFCCRGDRSIEAAAQEKGIELPRLLSELSQAEATRSERSLDVQELGTEALIRHIIATYHEPLRQVLPFLNELAAKVNRVHGEKNPKLEQLRIVVEELRGALLPHLDREETILFPALTEDPVDVGRVADELSTMVEDHLAVAALLERLHQATDEFTVPAWGCNSYRTLFSELERLEGELLSHVHLENHVLMPRFSSRRS